MKIENVEFECYIDFIGRTIHLLELHRSQFGLLNIIDPHFQMEVIEKGYLLIDVMDFDWICYGSGGLIMEYKDYSLMFVSKEDNRLHKPFMGVSGTK